VFRTLWDSLVNLLSLRDPPGADEPPDDRVFEARGHWYVQASDSTVLGPYGSKAEADTLAVLFARRVPDDDTPTLTRWVHHRVN
jgi:hypothetical protein